jgi:hypothetical protein
MTPEFIGQRRLKEVTEVENEKKYLAGLKDRYAISIASAQEDVRATLTALLDSPLTWWDAADLICGFKVSGEDPVLRPILESHLSAEKKFEAIQEKLIILQSPE